ncbi:hypothetical protein EWB00_004806, partial [Schistosoma japonicum]
NVPKALVRSHDWCSSDLSGVRQLSPMTLDKYRAIFIYHKLMKVGILPLDTDSVEWR